MNSLRFAGLVCVQWGLGCLLSGPAVLAQTVSVPALAPVSVPTPRPVSADVTVRKRYAEFHSICTSEEKAEFELAHLPVDVRKSRISLIEAKLQKAKTDEKTKLALQLRTRLVSEYLAQGLSKQADDEFRSIYLDLEEGERVVLSASIDIDRKLLRQAQTNLNKFLEKNPRHQKGLEKLAEVYESLESYNDEFMVYSDLAGLNVKTKSRYLPQLCRVAALNADHTNIKQHCGSLLRDEGFAAIARIYLGISARDQENYKEAQKYFTESLKVRKTEFASTCLAEIFTLTAKTDEAISQFAESLVLQPRSKRAQLGLATAYVKNGAYDQALVHFKSACELGLAPAVQMAAIAAQIKNHKNEPYQAYVDEMIKCKK